jgi:transcriptional regulator with XRE-family HTH domain
MQKEIGKLIRAERTKAGLSQGDLARRAGIAHASLSRIENGNRSPNMSTLDALAQALQVDVHELIPHRGGAT